MSRAAVHGVHDPRFAPLVGEFAEMVADDGPGAALCVEVGGTPVVDVWAGLADAVTGRRWEHDTPVLVFSCTKAWLSGCVLHLVAHGRLDLDAPIVRYWPEFAAAGTPKARVTVADALSHRAGLPLLDGGLLLEDVLGWTGVVAALERQPPLFAPTHGWAYHALTFGHLLGEVVRRVDGRMPGRYFADVFAGPLGLESWIGAPGDVVDRAARVVAVTPWAHPTPDQVRGRVDDVVATLELGGALAPAFDLDSDHGWNSRPLLQAEVPAANGVSTARGLARFWSALVDPERSAVPAALVAAAVRPRSGGEPLLGAVDAGVRWGLGFEVAGAGPKSLLGPTSAGHDGAAGSLGFGDVDAHVGFGFTTAEFAAAPNDRADRLVARLAEVLDGGHSPFPPRSVALSGVPR